MTDKLKALALAAKAEDADQSWYSSDDLLTGVIDREADAAYIAAASPDAILALLKRAEDAEAEVVKLTGLGETDDILKDEIARQKVCIMALAENIQHLVSEKVVMQDKLRVYETHGVTCQTYGHVVGACAECNTHSEVEQLRAELARLKAQEPVAWYDEKLGVFDEKQFDQLKPLYLHKEQK